MLRRVMLLATAACLLSSGCTSDSTDHATIQVDHVTALADQPVRLAVSGLHPHAGVTLSAQAPDRDGKTWRAEATFTADDHGAIDLDRAGPTGGSYQGVDGMGLFWSMNPPDGDPDLQAYAPPAEDGRPVEHVEIQVLQKGKTLADVRLTRQWLAAGVTTKTLTLAADKVSGVYVAPPRDAPNRPAVLVFGGSEGGLGVKPVAALLASHGYPVLAIAYFHAPGLPQDLRDIPLEYFATAARWLARQPGVDPAHLIALSASRGTEAALLLSDHFPDLVHGAVLYAPTDVVVGSFPEIGGAAWTLGGRELQYDARIPVDHVSGPVLAIAGSDDQLWPSMTAAPRIALELDDAHNRFPHRALIYPQAGHAVSGAPYLPMGTKEVHPVTRRVISLGGTRAGNEAALRQGWTAVLALLESLAR
ncbi:acyl-CoA thioesterase/bile acid-CoA:amino acid N-acyltransferase family protein [Kribbella sp. NPDC050281]|uniref:acyl-CoA thioesterase/bile acid-CoA:amino acid N-acyltransferase family protein n=1 Tax=Kribbella sp. NPDC050281 TaxID=3155515 RepID=UPI0033D4C649